MRATQSPLFVLAAAAKQPPFRYRRIRLVTTVPFSPAPSVSLFAGKPLKLETLAALEEYMG